MRTGIAVPLREEDHNWCPWIVGTVTHEQNIDPDIVIRTVKVKFYQDEVDVAAMIHDLTAALRSAGFTIMGGLIEARLHWPDF